MNEDHGNKRITTNMSSMNEDHGQNHETGGREADDQPPAPVPPREHATSKVPPIPAGGPASAGPAAKSPVKQDDLLRSSAAVDSQQSAQPSPPVQLSLPTGSSAAPQESLVDVVRIVEQSAMPEQARLAVLLGLLHKMSPTLHDIAVSAKWDSCLVVQALSPGSRDLPPPAIASGRGQEDGREGPVLVPARGGQHSSGGSPADPRERSAARSTPAKPPPPSEPAQAVRP